MHQRQEYAWPPLDWHRDCEVSMKCKRSHRREKVLWLESGNNYWWPHWDVGSERKGRNRIITPRSSEDEKPEIWVHLKAGTTDAIRRGRERTKLPSCKSSGQSHGPAQRAKHRDTLVKEVGSSYCTLDTLTTATQEVCGLISCLLPYWTEYSSDESTSEISFQELMQEPICRILLICILPSLLTKKQVE